MLGWDPLRDSKNLPMFSFSDVDLGNMQDQLLDTLPGDLYPLVSERPLTVDAFRHLLANKTAAQFADMDTVVLQLAKEGEFDILDPNGKPRSRQLTRLQSTDLISRSGNLLLPGFSRRNKN